MEPNSTLLGSQAPEQIDSALVKDVANFCLATAIAIQYAGIQLSCHKFTMRYANTFDENRGLEIMFYDLTFRVRFDRKPLKI